MAEHLYVLGHPVAHSLSPALYNAVYPLLGLDWVYGIKDCSTEREARAFIEAGGFPSINITTPYKPLALSCARSASAAARLAQGANVLVAVPGGFVADNTDGVGCVSSLEREGVAIEGASVAVCGTGPAARSIMNACVFAGCERVTLLGRDGARARQAVEAYRGGLEALSARGEEANPLGISCVRRSVEAAIRGFDVSASAYGRPEAARAIEGAGVVVDATTLGMHAGDPAPFDTSLLHEGQAVLDVVYAHGETALLAGARAQGCRAFDGLGMLVGQAVATVQGIAYVRGDVDLSGADLFSVMEAAVRL